MTLPILPSADSISKREGPVQILDESHSRICMLEEVDVHDPKVVQ